MSEAHVLALEERVEALVEQTGGQVDVGDVAGVVTSIMQSWRGSFSLHELHVRDEIRELLAYVEGAKRELCELRPRTLSSRDIPDASTQLDAIVAATEEAADKMMDVAEEIEALASDVANDDIQPRMSDIATRIYEASSFQDITGQRISKVVRILQHLEEKLGALAETLGDEDIPDQDASVFDAVTGEVEDPKALLHGPQLPTEANSQDDIDALLASFD